MIIFFTSSNELVSFQKRSINPEKAYRFRIDFIAWVIINAIIKFMILIDEPIDVILPMKILLKLCHIK